MYIFDVHCRHRSMDTFQMECGRGKRALAARRWLLETVVAGYDSISVQRMQRATDIGEVEGRKARLPQRYVSWQCHATHADWLAHCSREAAQRKSDMHCMRLDSI